MPPEIEPERNAAAGGGEGLLKLMEQFAREAGRSELADVPFLFWGWSSAAGFGPSFALLHPDRTVAFIRYHSHMRGLPNGMQTAKEIPALIFVGGQDDPALVEDSTTMFSRGRAVGAPWAIVSRAAVPHQIRAADIEAASRLTMPWVTAVVNGRLGDGVRLQAMPTSEGWLGDETTGRIVRVPDAEPSQRHRSWLPDERTAAAWQSLVAAPK